jgi:hypothetical protein
MKKQDREYWDYMILDEDVRKFAKNNPKLVTYAIQNLKDLQSSGVMSFDPWMAGLFVIVYGKTNNEQRVQLAIDILESIKGKQP